MSRELCNCSNLMTHPCTTPAPKHGLQNLHMVQTLVLDGKPEPKFTETTLCPPAPPIESTTDAGSGEMAKALGTSARPGLGATLRCQCWAWAARGKFSINKILLIIIVIPSQLVQEQPAARGASKAPCKASPEAHSDENWLPFPTPALCSPCPAKEEL